MSEPEDVVAKYKRLLTMAKTSLEANQKLIVEKDNKIAELKAALEEAKHANRHGMNGDEDGSDIYLYVCGNICGQISDQGISHVVLI